MELAANAIIAKVTVCFAVDRYAKKWKVNNGNVAKESLR